MVKVLTSSRVTGTKIRHKLGFASTNNGHNERGSRQMVVSGRRALSAQSDDKDYGVRIWGNGNNGRLGFRSEQKQSMWQPSKALLQPQVLPGFKDAGARNISCGSEHTAMVTTKGELLMWGSHQYSKLGDGSRKGQRGDIYAPWKLPSPPNTLWSSVACGEYHTVALDTEGRPYSWGWGGSLWNGGSALGHGSKATVAEPKAIEFFDGMKVTKVTAGENHTAFLTDEGQIFVCGAGEYGRCGNGKTSNQLTPQAIEMVHETDGQECGFKDVEAGHAFCIALTTRGNVMSWGRNDAGQLGVGSGVSMDVYAMDAVPAVLGGFDEEVTNICAGHNHAAAVTKSGALFMWGMKQYFEPEQIFSTGQKDVGCGYKYTGAISANGELYTFGKNTPALGRNYGKASDTKVEWMVKLSEVEKVVEISCGKEHMAALVKTQR